MTPTKENPLVAMDGGFHDAYAQGFDDGKAQALTGEVVYQYRLTFEYGSPWRNAEEPMWLDHQKRPSRTCVMRKLVVVEAL